MQTHPNRHQAPHKHYNTEYNIIRGSDLECKEVQGLVTEVVSAGVSVVWLVDFVNPHISKNEPDKEKTCTTAYKGFTLRSSWLPSLYLIPQVQQLVKIPAAPATIK